MSAKNKKGCRALWLPVALFWAVCVPGRCLAMDDVDLPRIVVLTLLGVRNAETIGDPAHRYIPRLWEMFKTGTLYNDLVNDNVAFHMPAVSATFDGKTHRFYSGETDLTTPTIFQYVRKTYSLPATKLWVMGIWSERSAYYDTADYSWDTHPCLLTSFKLLMPSPQDKKAVYDSLTAQEKISLERYDRVVKEDKTWPQWDGSTRMQYHLFKKVMRNFKPLFIHFVMNDMEAGHYGSFGKYVLALKECDQRIYDIWQFINTDPFYKGKTYLFVTIDCERDFYYMQHYKSSSEAPSHVWMYIYGPDVKKGVVIDRPVFHRDIFATVAHLMKVKTHRHDGSILDDGFEESARRKE